MKKTKISGFTLIELLIVMAILAILLATTVIIIKPATQLAKARDTQRESHLVAIVTIILQYSSEHGGALPDTDGDPATSNFPTDIICIGTDPSCFDLSSAGESGDTIVPIYTSSIPYDPKGGDDGNTQYLIGVDANNRLTASASGETRTIILTR